jgi:AcrR family transcriptional regulator
MVHSARNSMTTKRRRQLILEVALKVFATEGFRNTEVQAIADLARVGKGTVYRYFGNKQKLFLATARASVEWLAQDVASRMVGARTTAELLRRIAVSCAQYCQAHSETVEITIQERAEFRETVFSTALMFRGDKSGGLVDMIRNASQGGEFREVDPLVTATTFLDLIYGSVVCGCLAGGRQTLVSRMNSAMDLFLEGILNRDAHGVVPMQAAEAASLVLDQKSGEHGSQISIDTSRDQEYIEFQNT